jgi:hypothetical protein
MSQHVWTYKNFEALTGWDRPLQYFFLVISRTDISEDDEETDEFVFSNLRLDNPSMSIEEIVSVLNKLEIPYPAQLAKRLQEDKRNDSGHRVDYGILT